MKQVYFFIVFCLTQTLCFADSEPIINKPGQIIKTMLSKHDNKVYIFYEDHFVCIDLDTKERRKMKFNSNGVDLKSLRTLSSSTANYFLDGQGGGVYLFEN